MERRLTNIVGADENEMLTDPKPQACGRNY